jgi:hypothetical protein
LTRPEAKVLVHERKNMKLRRTIVCMIELLVSLALGINVAGQAKPPSELKTRNVVLIVTDGLRWQEVFQGPDNSLMNQEHGGVENIDTLRRDFWRTTPTQSRETVFPFLWKTVAHHGQIFGNQDKESIARVANGFAFSYPGYNEMIVGFPDPHVDKNDFGPNPNVTVFEWLNRIPELQGRVAVFGTWDAFKDIFNQKRSGLFISAGWDPIARAESHAKQALLDDFYGTTTRLWDDNVYDAFLQPLMLDYVQAHQPRVLFIGYGETDEWAHTGRYDLLLRAAHQFDKFVEQLWNTMQSMPAYHDQTTFIITTDHGRGGGLTEWKDHGTDRKGSENIWIGVLGPDTQPLGEREHTPAVTQSQIATTMAALFGKDYRGSVLQAAGPLPGVVAPQTSNAVK